MSDLQVFLERSAARHSHLCPRQVLGVRIGLAGAATLGMELPRRDKRLLVIVETDGCFVDGVEVATGCSVGHRTLRVADYGKIAATFVQVETGLAVRVSPQPDVRQRAWKAAPGEKRRYFAQLNAYQHMTADELLSIDKVVLRRSLAEIISRPGLRVPCDGCGEEIINAREIYRDGLCLCRACAGPVYYRPAVVEETLPVWSDPRLINSEA